MRLVLPIEELVPGMFVDSVHKQASGSEVKIKTRGLVRSEDIVAKLAEKGVLELNIDFTQSEISVPEKYQALLQRETLSPSSNPAAEHTETAIEGIPLKQEFSQAAYAFDQHNQALRVLYSEVVSGLNIDMPLIQDVTKDIVASVLRNANALSILTQVKEKDAYNWRHMTNCSVLTAVFGQYLGFPTRIIEQMTLGALLHDIGHTKLPQGIINKEKKVTDREFLHIKRHVIQSYGLTRGKKGVTPIVLDMIVNHHERLDGSGYPRGLKAKSLSKFARIMAIIDVYDAITSDRPHQTADQPIKALKYLLDNKHQFDQTLVQHFIKCIGIHPVGTVVRLSNERLGLVLEGNRTAPKSPLVKLFYNTKHSHHVTAKDLDLSCHSHGVMIEGGVNLSDYQINLSRLLKEHLIA